MADRQNAVCGVGPARWRRVLGSVAASPIARVAILVVLLLVAAVSLASQWPSVWPKVRAMDPAAVALALALGVVPSVAGSFQWRFLLATIDVAPPVRIALPATCIGQLGKYLPGSVWPIMFQAELVRPYGVRRDRAAAAGLLAMVFMLAGGAFVGAVVLVPSLTLSSVARAGVGLLGLGALLVLRPSLLTRGINRLLRLMRQEPLSVALTWRAAVGAFAWGVLIVVALGLHAYVLARELGPASFASVVGGFLLAWAAGFLVPVLPAGGGVREAILYAALGPSLGHAGALALAAVSRMLLVVVDLLVGTTAALSRRFVIKSSPEQLRRRVFPEPRIELAKEEVAVGAGVHHVSSSS